MILSATNEVNLAFEGCVDEENRKTPQFETLLSLNCLHTNTLKSYLLSFELTKLTILYGNYKTFAT